jgi:hypothetical protein
MAGVVPCGVRVQLGVNREVLGPPYETVTPCEIRGDIGISPVIRKLDVLGVDDSHLQVSFAYFIHIFYSVGWPY